VLAIGFRSNNLGTISPLLMGTYILGLGYNYWKCCCEQIIYLAIYQRTILLSVRKVAYHHSVWVHHIEGTSFLTSHIGWDHPINVFWKVHIIMHGNHSRTIPIIIYSYGGTIISSTWMPCALGGGFLAMLKKWQVLSLEKTYPNHSNYIHPGIIVKWTLNWNLDFIIYSHKREGI